MVNPPELSWKFTLYDSFWQVRLNSEFCIKYKYAWKLELMWKSRQFRECAQFIVHPGRKIKENRRALKVNNTCLGRVNLPKGTQESLQADVPWSGNHAEKRDKSTSRGRDAHVLFIHLIQLVVSWVFVSYWTGTERKRRSNLANKARLGNQSRLVSSPKPPVLRQCLIVH